MAKKHTARRLKPARRDAFITAAMNILYRGKPTVFRFEAALRSGLRSRFCAEGWRWQDAHDAAEDVTLTALARIGAVRPSWQDGQAYFVNDGAARIESTRCIQCGGGLPEGHWRFCGKLCRDVHGKRTEAGNRREDERAITELSDAA